MPVKHVINYNVKIRVKADIIRALLSDPKAHHWREALVLVYELFDTEMISYWAYLMAAHEFAAKRH